MKQREEEEAALAEASNLKKLAYHMQQVQDIGWKDLPESLRASEKFLAFEEMFNTILTYAKQASTSKVDAGQKNLKQSSVLRFVTKP